MHGHTPWIISTTLYLTLFDATLNCIYNRGVDIDGGIYSDKVHVLNCTINQVSLLNDGLSYPLWGSSPVIVNNTIFFVWRA